MSAVCFQDPGASLSFQEKPCKGGVREARVTGSHAGFSHVACAGSHV